ncbi:MAG: MerR family DNA-binding transcriptional regulator [Thiothrix sp.]|nr:MerR family DNA-binding transcriptional regulator [Thiothrix sp.]HPE60950.1 MerR family DNA-binding transcriptional regulator [Thiolinea sp.]
MEIEKQPFWSISDLSDEFGLSQRAIRFYENKGLLTPRRLGANRVYNYQDKARLKLILRGKRLGFSLDDIREFIALYDVALDPDQQEQLHYLLKMVQSRLQQLKKQQEDLIATISELGSIEQECLFHINQAGQARKPAP